MKWGWERGHAPHSSACEVLCSLGTWGHFALSPGRAPTRVSLHVWLTYLGKLRASPPGPHCSSGGGCCSCGGMSGEWPGETEIQQVESWREGKVMLRIDLVSNASEPLHMLFPPPGTHFSCLSWKSHLTPLPAPIKCPFLSSSTFSITIHPYQVLITVLYL